MSATCLDVFDYAQAVTVPVPACPVCGIANRARPAIDRYGYSIGASQCKCELVYLNPRMTEDGYARFYRDTYRSLAAVYGGRDDPRADQARALGIARILSGRHVHAGHLVDVGGGTGLVATAIGASLGATSVTVIDPNATELCEAAARGCRTVCSPIETAPLPEPKADLLLCLLTADHWLEPMVALRWLRAALADQGRLWIDILDAKAIRANYPLAAWKIDHPLYWTPKSFERALARADWSVIGRWRNLAANRRSYLCAAGKDA